MSITNTFHIDHVVAFKTMLSDSKIIGQFTLDEKKLDILLLMDILLLIIITRLPYFDNGMLRSISQCNYLVTSFNESLTNVV